MSLVPTLFEDRGLFLDRTIVEGLRKRFDAAYASIDMYIPCQKKHLWFSTMTTMTRSEVSACFQFMRHSWKGLGGDGEFFETGYMFGMNLTDSISMLFSLLEWAVETEYRREFFLYFYIQAMGIVCVGNEDFNRRKQ